MKSGNGSSEGSGGRRKNVDRISSLEEEQNSR